MIHLIYKFVDVECQLYIRLEKSIWKFIAFKTNLRYLIKIKAVKGGILRAVFLICYMKIYEERRKYSETYEYQFSFQLLGKQILESHESHINQLFNALYSHLKLWVLK